jgi:hypothetical protein
MVENIAEWLYLLALIVPTAAVLLGIVALVVPGGGGERQIAPRRSHAHA